MPAMPLHLPKRRNVRVRTSSNPANMGACFSNFKTGRENNKIIRVKQGLLEGERLVTPDGAPCDVFLGIPYAQPPVGNLRFKKPQPVEDWEGVRKAKKYPNRSIHKEMFWDKVQLSAPQSEDCLYLNVFAPQIRDDKKYPVLFYIHGGGWMMDSAERYTPKNVCRLLVQREIIVVTMHYRLGFLGFLSTGDEACFGNFGLFDMLEALKWTHANISSFGGDPENITISGQSAGAAAADLLSISPLAKGLFNKKIIMGGNSYCHWATTKKQDIRAFCRKKAVKLGWKPRDYYSSQLEESHDIVNFFKQVPASKLGTTMHFSKIIFSECRLPLAPVIDGEILPHRLSVLQAAAPDVPSIVGGGEYEALLFCAIGMLRGTDKEIEHALNMLAQKNGVSREKVDELTRRIYGDSSAMRTSSKLKKKFYVEMVSDVFVNYAHYRFMKDNQKKTADCYAYSFDYQSINMWGWLRHAVPFTGGTHTSDVTYLFDCNYMASPLGMTRKDKKMSHMTADYFTNFVKFGTPNGSGTTSHLPKWEVISKEDEKMMLFSLKPEPEMAYKAFEDRIQKYEDAIGFMFDNKSIPSSKTSIVININPN